MNAATPPRPSGTVTFLFTDIEGSTRRWEADPDAMSNALALHDETLGTAIAAQGGWLFKHTGDGVCAAFSSATDAVAAAIDTQRVLGLPVRMGLATGTAELRDDDYFGPVLNRTARVMSAGHGGQILLSTATAALVSGVDLIDLGEHRLRDLSGVEHLFQVRADRLRAQFPPLRTLDAVPGNLPIQTTSLVGRDVEVKELAELVRAHRLVTLTGVGGVGKTRLALQVAAELVGEFPDGVWLIELAPVGDPDALPDAVASVLGITPHDAVSVTESIALALSGRRMLLVLDNCEHLLDAAADLIEAILARTTTVKVIATSREGLQVAGEQLWAVPSLDVADGANSAAVELFVQRAQSVVAGFALRDERELTAVIEICRRLDGVALAIELAAARMVSMSAQDVCDRLGDRFRLLAGSRRGLHRHQTLRHTVGWSYDLLSDDQRTVLQCCSVFAGGFEVSAAMLVCAEFDEYALLDVLDSLVRKSLVTVERVGGHARYRLLETIRPFAEEQMAATGVADEVRDRHAAYFAREAAARWDTWDGPGYDSAVDWVDVEFANLRAGFRWAVDRDVVAIATAIAAHTAMLAWGLQRFEPVKWAEELLDAGNADDEPGLARLYTAASLCALTGRPEVAVGYAQTAMRLATDPRSDSFDPGWAGYLEALGHVFAGRLERSIETFADLAARPGMSHVVGLCGATRLLPAAGRVEEAIAIAEETVAVAGAHANPFWIAFAHYAYGTAFAEADPSKALRALRTGLVHTQARRLPYFEALITRESASLEASHGNADRALELFDASLDSLHRAGNLAHVAVTLAYLTACFDGSGQFEIAATIYGTVGHFFVDTSVVRNLPTALEHLHGALGDGRFDECVGAGAAMELPDAVRYARDHIRRARDELAGSS